MCCAQREMRKEREREKKREKKEGKTCFVLFFPFPDESPSAAGYRRAALPFQHQTKLAFVVFRLDDFIYYANKSKRKNFFLKMKKTGGEKRKKGGRGFLRRTRKKLHSFFSRFTRKNQRHWDFSFFFLFFLFFVARAKKTSCWRWRSRLHLWAEEKKRKEKRWR